MLHTSHIRVDLNAIAHNHRAIQDAVGPGTEVCGVVKADAYGLGAKQVSRALVSAGAKRLAVFTPDQAAELEDVVPEARILVFMPVDELPRRPGLARLCASGRLELVVVDHAQVASLAGLRMGRPVRVHVEVDCGIGRSGVLPGEAAALVQDVLSRRSLQLAGIFTHFSSSDPRVIDVEAARFDRVISDLGNSLPPRTLVHAASSGPCFSAPVQRRSMVRIGMGWSGWLPCDRSGTDRPEQPGLDLQGAVNWASSIIQVRDIPVGTSVGYGSEWTATSPTRIGLVSVGYADGYPSTLVDQGEPQRVLVDTREGMRSAPVIGAVNMDQLVVDLGNLDSCERFLGREVLLLSSQQNSSASLHSVARRAGIPGHQLLACISKRIPRVYLAEATGREVKLDKDDSHQDRLGDASSAAAC